jgi:glucose uptake protein GlcU
MLYFFIDNIFVLFGGRMYQQTMGISIGTNCTPLLAVLFYILMKQTTFKGFSIIKIEN